MAVVLPSVTAADTFEVTMPTLVANAGGNVFEATMAPLVANAGGNVFEVTMPALLANAGGNVFEVTMPHLVANIEENVSEIRSLDQLTQTDDGFSTDHCADLASCYPPQDIEREMANMSLIGMDPSDPQ
ncbi:MAG: hypothetical protein AAGH38_11745, partial [Pseudomonadota bacterium]